MAVQTLVLYVQEKHGQNWELTVMVLQMMLPLPILRACQN